MFCTFLLQLNMAKGKHVYLLALDLKTGKKSNWP